MTASGAEVLFNSTPRRDDDNDLLPLDPELHLQLPRSVFFRPPILDSPKEFPRARCGNIGAGSLEMGSVEHI